MASQNLGTAKGCKQTLAQLIRMLGAPGSCVGSVHVCPLDAFRIGSCAAACLRCRILSASRVPGCKLLHLDKARAKGCRARRAGLRSASQAGSRP